MIHLKSNEEIKIMAGGGRRLRKVVGELRLMMRPGVTTSEIDSEAERLIIKEGGEPSFKTVKGYHWTTCLPINEQIVHTPPSKRVLMDGDVLTIDIGMLYKGYHTDYATTLVVGENKDKETVRFLEVGKKALNEAIFQAGPGKRLGEISQAIEKEIYGNGYFVVKSLTGHGIGKALHEDPYVFGFTERPIYETLIIKPGLTIAIEVIYSKGSEEFIYESGSDWSVVTSDDSLSACFEHTIAVTNRETIVLT